MTLQLRLFMSRQTEGGKGWGVRGAEEDEGDVEE